MKILKCGICGGKIVPNNDVGICDSCGAMVSLASLQDDRIIESMNRANEARVNQNFDEAYRAWSLLVAEKPDNAEAHWNLALSRYGIEYVWDGLMATFVPTINRLRYDQFSNDPDCSTAIQLADENVREFYIAQARQLQDIQNRLLELIRNEQPYEVFISFKAEDNGIRTKDSELAQEIYLQLQKKGIRAFYSRISLTHCAGNNYEPYIFSALHSSKIMILVGTQPDYLMSTWVKNEWSRFIALMREDQSKHLIPVYERMPVEFFPDEISVREALDMTSPGAMRDLTNGILRILDKEHLEEVAPLVEKMRVALGERDFSEVIRLGKEVLKADASNPDAWFFLFLGENFLFDESQLLTEVVNWMNSEYFSRAYELSSGHRKRLLEDMKYNYEIYREKSLQDSFIQEEVERRKARSHSVINQAIAKMQVGHYEAASKILEEDSLDHEELDHLRSVCDVGVEYEKINKDKYLAEELKENQPDGYAAFLNLVKKRTFKRVFSVSHIITGIFVVLLFAVSWILTQKYTGYYMPVIVLKRIAVFLLSVLLILLLIRFILRIIKKNPLFIQNCRNYYEKNVLSYEESIHAQYQKKFQILNAYCPIQELDSLWELTSSYKREKSYKKIEKIYILILLIISICLIIVWIRYPFECYINEENTATIMGYKGEAIVEIPSKVLFWEVKAISGEGFKDNNKITEVHIPDTVTSIGSSAFAGCKNLKAVTFSDNLEYIGSFAFADCKQLSEVFKISDTASIGTGAFLNTRWLYDREEEYLLIGDNHYIYLSDAEEVVVPDGVKTIDFYLNKSIKYVVLPDSLSVYSPYCFQGCSGLYGVSGPVKSKREYSFGGTKVPKDWLSSYHLYFNDVDVPYNVDTEFVNMCRGAQ